MKSMNQADFFHHSREAIASSTSLELNRRRFRLLGTVIVASLCLFQASCARSDRPVAKDKVPLTHVTGTVIVDGEPTSGITVNYVPLGEIEEKRPQYRNGFSVQTDSNGSFSLKTYAKGDGVPAGEYALLLTYFSQDKAEQIRDGEYDKFGGLYSNLSKPFQKIKVELDQDLDLGEFELKTVPKKQK